jgi:sec-independent protein translocase protein TatC
VAFHRARPEPGEKRYAYPFVASSLVLFLGGTAVAYAVFPHTLRFLGTIGGPSLQQIYGPSSYIGLLLLMMVAFAGIITPSSDPFSMLALAVPLLVFYELSIVVGRLFLRSRATAS